MNKGICDLYRFCHGFPRIAGNVVFIRHICRAVDDYRGSFGRPIESSGYRYIPMQEPEGSGFPTVRQAENGILPDSDEKSDTENIGHKTDKIGGVLLPDKTATRNAKSYFEATSPPATANRKPHRLGRRLSKQFRRTRIYSS